MAKWFRIYLKNLFMFDHHASIPFALFWIPIKGLFCLSTTLAFLSLALCTTRMFVVYFHETRFLGRFKFLLKRPETQGIGALGFFHQCSTELIIRSEETDSYMSFLRKKAPLAKSFL